MKKAPLTIKALSSKFLDFFFVLGASAD